MLEVKIMGVSYKKLWMLIIEKDLKKKAGTSDG